MTNEKTAPGGLQVAKRKAIPDDVRTQVEQAVARFNQSLTGRGTAYVARFSGSFVYLDRGPSGREHPTRRLKYAGPGGKWEFAIYKHTSNAYDARDWFFPGSEHLDGTIEGALRAATEAYPP